MRLASLSVFLPLYNEDQNLQPMVASFLEVLPKITSDYEIILVDDGSRDQTGPLADTLAKNNPRIRVIHHPHNLGYGASLRSGFNTAQKEWTFFTDGDGQFDVHELRHFIPYTSDYQVVIGYRKKRIEGGMRVINAGLYKIYINLLFRLHVIDIDCAFKLIKTEYLKQINFISTGATINAELLYRLKKMHLTFKQLPVTHRPRLHGSPTGNNPKVILKAGIESIKLYLAMKFGWKFS